MASALAANQPTAFGGAPALTLDVRRLRHAALWLFVACGAFVSVEPSPYEFMFVVVALLFARQGLIFDRSFIPMLLCLGFFEAGGLLALPPFLGDSKAVTFVATSVYIAVTAVFFAALIAGDPLGRMKTIKSGYVAAGFIAAVLGILGYFDVGGLGEHFTLYNHSRASGPFKDPNVFGPFLVPPIVWLTQDMLLKRGYGLRRLAPLVVILFGLFLSFSRGAWGALVTSLALMALLTFATAKTNALRQRIVMLTVLGALAMVVLLLIALSIPSIREIFEVRASLDQYYDVGELGRFGAQKRSIPMLLERPFGFGPLQYNKHFPEDVHEVYINAFSAYGWLGGLSFAAFTVTTLYVGARVAFLRSPFQAEAIAVCACLVTQMIQGFQIDTDHWRHLYLLFGALYGLTAASRLHRVKARREEDQRRAVV